MKVTIIKNIPGMGTERPHTLFMQPETDRDREILERLVKEFRCTNMGRDASTLKIIHAAIEIQEVDDV